MILGMLKDAACYSGFGERVQKALQYMLEHDFETLPAGKYSVDGDNIKYEISEFETVKAEGKLFEAHKKFIDIQMTISGEEWYGYGFLGDMKEKIPYDSDKDAGFYSGEGIYIQVPKGQFVLFMPEDAHNPGVYFNRQGKVKKVVFKVRI